MARANLFIKTGTYTGDGNDARDITGVGFQPDLVIIKGGANAAVWRNKMVPGDLTLLFGANSVSLANAIQGLMSDGFQVGTDVTVNASATVYYYVAIRGFAGQSNYRVGNYRGSGGDDRNYTGGGLNFTPDLVWIKKDGSDNPVFRTSDMVGDSASHFPALADAANEIQNLQSNGFQLGTSSRANASGSDYYFAAFKKLGGAIACGTYVGDQTDNREITGAGFTPDFVLVKTGTTATAGFLRTSDFSGDSSVSVGAVAPTTNLIQGFSSDGFQIGSALGVNKTGDTFWWFAFKSGSFACPITRLAA